MTLIYGAAKDVLRKTGLLNLLLTFMNQKEIQLYLLLSGIFSYVVLWLNM